MRIGITGCGHGELDKMYEALAFAEKKDGVKVELLICCGDFQSCRNLEDMSCMACPPKYRDMHTFYQYYSGEKRAPVLTIFVGGNHEASNYLLELAHGGWVAPNIWYMGWASVVRYGGLRIGGLSGIFKEYDFRRGHWECPPFDDNAMRSVFHVREFDYFRLVQTSGKLDIFISHDWPRGIDAFGDSRELVRKKKGFKSEVDQGMLGNPASRKLLEALKPKYWFSAHLHVKFAGLMNHPTKKGEEPHATRFLALDKCLPHRDYLQILDFPEVEGGGRVGARTFSYDPEWLAIMKSTNELLSLENRAVILPTAQNTPAGKRYDFKPTEEELKWVVSAFERKQKEREEAGKEAGKAEEEGGADQKGDPLEIPRNFTPTAPAYTPESGKRQCRGPTKFVNNPQTEELLATLEMQDKLGIQFGGKLGEIANRGGCNPEEIVLDL